MLSQTPSRLSLAHLPTPLSKLNQSLIPETTLWVKHDDATGGAVSGNKIRKLEFLLAEAMKLQVSVVITCGGLQSNHCRATAIACAKLGLKCHLILRRGDNPELEGGLDGNWLIDELAGAKITILDAKDYQTCFQETLDSLVSQYLQAGEKSYFIPTGGSDETGLWGYLEAAKELDQDFKIHRIQPEYVVCASGSGGTQAGLTLGFHLLQQLHPEVVFPKVLGVAVCDSSEYFNRKVNKDVSSWAKKYSSIAASFDLTDLQPCTIDRYIGPGYAKGYAELYQTIKTAASTNGVLLDPVYTGKAFYGMLEELNNGILAGAKNVVFVHTGGTFGLFPQRGNF